MIRPEVSESPITDPIKYYARKVPSPQLFNENPILITLQKRVKMKKIIKTVHYACLLYKYYINRIRIQFVFPDQDPQDYHLL